jgi:hypothetical protein
VTVALSIPGALILGWEALRGDPRAPASGAPHPTTHRQF